MKITSVRPELPVITIVGRPNVGKSSLFNALLRQRLAIVHEEAGVTRDRVTAVAHHEGHSFQLVDTGGLGVMAKATRGVEFFDEQIRTQLTVAIESSDLIMVVVDIKVGLTPMDREVCSFLRGFNKPMILAANKCDNPETAKLTAAFNGLGLGEAVPVSCSHRLNLGTLADALLAKLPRPAAEEGSEDAQDGDVESPRGPAPERPVAFALVGRPNVGKSSLVNRLLGEERVIVSDVAGTTRDAVDVAFTFEDENGIHPGILIDTAGLRRKKKVDTVVEMFSLSRTEAAFKRADIILYVMDAEEGILATDKKICGMVEEAGKPCLIVVNKWDLSKDLAPQKEFSDNIKKELPFLAHAPICFVSAKTGLGMGEILPTALKVQDNASVNIPTALLNQVLQDMVARTPPPAQGMGFFKVYYGTFKSEAPAKFIIFCNKKNYCPDAYSRFIENTLRKTFGLAGVQFSVEYRERRHLQDKLRKENGLPGHIKQKLADQAAKRYRASKKFRGR